MKNLTKIIVFAVLLILLFLTTFFIVKFLEKEKIKILANKLEEIEGEITPIRFKILSYDNNNINIAIKLYDIDNKEITRKEFDLEGEQLFFEFLVVHIKKNFVAFPYKIYSDKISVDKGIQIFTCYDSNGFPQIYYSENNDNELINGLINIFEKIKKGKIKKIESIFKTTVLDIKTNQQFKERQIYKVVMNIKGEIEIVEDF